MSSLQQLSTTQFIHKCGYQRRASFDHANQQILLFFLPTRQIPRDIIKGTTASCKQEQYKTKPITIHRYIHWTAPVRGCRWKLFLPRAAHFRLFPVIDKFVTLSDFNSILFRMLRAKGCPNVIRKNDWRIATSSLNKNLSGSGSESGKKIIIRSYLTRTKKTCKVLQIEFQYWYTSITPNVTQSWGLLRLIKFRKLLKRPSSISSTW